MEIHVQDSLLQLWNENQATVVHIAYQVGLAIGVLIIAKIIGGALRQALQQTHNRLGKLDPMLMPILNTTLGYLVYTVAVVVILDLFGVNTASIIALIGAAGLAIGFALKDTLSNIAAGIMLLFLRPFKNGDYISFGSTVGTVEEINLFTTVLRSFDGLYLSCPNSSIWGNDITNFTRNGKRRIDITASIAYSDNIDTGLEVLRNIIKSEPRILAEPEAQAIVFSLGESSVDLQLRAWTTVEDFGTTKWDLNKRIKEDIEAAGLTIPFPQRDVRVIQ
jgi:small conductance mechanosensitive channel